MLHVIVWNPDPEILCDHVILFLEHPDYLIRSTAITQQKNLQDRIDAGEFEEMKTRRKATLKDSEKGHARQPRDGSKIHENFNWSKTTDSVRGGIIVALIGLLAAGFHLWRQARRRHGP